MNIHFNGKLVFTRSAATNPLNQWVHSDHLGTPRAKSDEWGNVVAGSREWFHPYGERGTASSDPVKYKFTGKERDVESGLDYFGARYYSSVQGRFTGVDPVDGTPADPQTWNKYSYTSNNPLIRIDPDGRRWFNGSTPTRMAPTRLRERVGRNAIRTRRTERFKGISSLNLAKTRTGARGGESLSPWDW
jgi:RHS repeat-associated protein